MRSFFRLATALAAGATLAAVPPTFAQGAGTVDLGLSGRYTIVDRDISYDNAIGFSGRFGIFVLRNFALELEMANSATTGDTDAKLQPYYVRLAYHKPLSNRWTGIIGAGWVHDRTNPNGPGGLYGDDGYSAMMGFQVKMSDRFALRFDAIGDVLMSPILQTATMDLKTGNIGLQAGFNFRLGKSSAPKDGDSDGVLDSMDACAGTAPGERVDSRGCVLPKDSDGDGVMDPSDRCGQTPAGSRVDTNGCPVDSDGDGVLDGVDGCPNTPADTRVDGRGCTAPGDADRDGVLDNADACPSTPTFTRVDSRGCPVPVDSDGDGVLDSADGCPNTPSGTRVDGRGCPLPTDSDSDGVMDPNDNCPGTAAGVRVDSRGCAIVFEEGRTNIVLEGVTFASGSSILTEGAKVVLDRMALALVNAPSVNVEVQGHTDNTGSPLGNTRISSLRADAVRAYLIEKGVGAARLTSRGYGPDAPIAPNTTASGRAQNRRVELKRTN